jgi:hypothetical protein
MMQQGKMKLLNWFQMKVMCLVFSRFFFPVLSGMLRPELPAKQASTTFFLNGR